MSLPDLLVQYGAAWRGDWSEMDGRGLRNEMETLAEWLRDDAYPGDTKARERFSLCPAGQGHWEWHCDSECGSND